MRASLASSNPAAFASTAIVTRLSLFIISELHVVRSVTGKGIKCDKVDGLLVFENNGWL
jgi:hypothetical protein